MFYIEVAFYFIMEFFFQISVSTLYFWCTDDESVFKCHHSIVMYIKAILVTLDSSCGTLV